MTENTIINNAIKKAKKNGFTTYIVINGINFFWSDPVILINDKFVKYKKLLKVQVDSTTVTYIGLNDLLFNHDFAKTFWGEDPSWGVVVYDAEGGSSDNYDNWQYHLQQMVLCENPLEYLKEFLSDE